MKKLVIFLVSLLFVMKLGAQDTPHFNTYWKNGLHVESDDSNFKFKMGGRIQFDVMFIKEDDSLHTHFDGKNGFEIRRARLYTSGSFFRFIKYKLQVEFAPARVVIKDAYLLFTRIPFVGNFQVGNFKQPFGMEMITSSKYMTNMERPLVNQFDHDRDLGVMLFNHHFHQRLAWYAGYFVPSNNLGKYIGNKYQITGRISALPLYKTKNGYKVLNIDAAYSYHYMDNKDMFFRVKPEAHLAPGYLEVNVEGINNNHRGNAGMALVLGSFSLQSEYTFAIIHPSLISELNESKYYLDAYFITVSWFITGEHKNFSKKKMAFDRVDPGKNLGKDGTGAFELSLRYSSIDFDDHDLQAGAMNDLTAGLNWYMNPAVRITFNYIYAKVVDLGHSNIFQMRFQVAF